MKRIIFGLALLPLLLSSCSGNTSSEPENYNTQSVTTTIHSGEIGDFALLAPDNTFSTNHEFTFSWEEASNADYYALEIATTVNFISDDPDEVYARETNISATKFDFAYSLPKDKQYFWRITAINKDHKKTTEPNHFFFESSKNNEIPIEIEDEQDWVIHKEGSQPQVSIDRNNFFGNDQNSLVILFDKEHTFQGIPSSDGWIVITKSADMELYGTNCFYLNFFYSGQDATVLIRVLDYDGEYWHRQVQISNNSKQTVLLKYTDFTLRTAGTNVFNRKFDWQHIRYFEIVFEKTYGDGVCVISNIKATNFENYQDLFVKDVTFNLTDSNDWTYENYNFKKTISADGKELTLGYPSAFNGYGFQNVNIYKFFDQGDALKMKVRYTGTNPKANFFFRILEEDNDRWQFKAPLSHFHQDDPGSEDDDNTYTDLVIPLKAFHRTDYLQGDGAKQMTFIQKINIGLSDNYTAGTLSIKDIQVFTLRDEYPEAKRVVGADGLIENFDNYELYTQIYYQWEQSTGNKDEAMKLDTPHKIGGSSNPQCGEFDYKADMEMAVYQLYLNTENVTGNKTAFSFWVKDNSSKFDKSIYDDITDKDIGVELTIQLTMDSGEWYRKTIDHVARDWTKYTFAFTDFECVNEDDLIDEKHPLSIEHIMHMALGFKYEYIVEKTHIPCYASANPVYFDNFYFTDDTTSSAVEIPGAMKPDADNLFVPIEDMEVYANNDAIFENWSYGNNVGHNLMTLESDEVSAQGGTHSIKMHYKGKTSVSYAVRTLFARRVIARGITLDIKGDGNANSIIYVNLNWRLGGSVIKMRKAIKGAAASWNRYTIGFDLFTDPDKPSSTKRIGLEDARNVESISFGIVDEKVESTASDIYIDNIKLNIECDYIDYIVTPIA